MKCLLEIKIVLLHIFKLNLNEEDYYRMYYFYADKSLIKMIQTKLLFDSVYSTIDTNIILLEDRL